VKGGKLAAACKGRVLALVLSDVRDDHASLVGSGPCAPDATTGGDAQSILRAHGIAAPASVARCLEEAKPLRPGSPELARAAHVTIGSTYLAAHEATQHGTERGYHGFRIREPLAGSAQRAGWRLARMAEDVVNGKTALPRPLCVVTGGETTVDARGAAGEGGRNQELALAFLDQLRVEATLAVMGTDGIDGATGAAGAVVDMGSKERAQALGLDARAHLARHDSHGFFRELGDTLYTGPTGTNVADLAVLLVR
ncbi:MAG: DUF4147 domain-containing protein, partial [Halobacteriales archaeon]|nr:DUF4147 domain-containing protein [Halobacteriales archaeon]